MLYVGFEYEDRLNSKGILLSLSFNIQRSSTPVIISRAIMNPNANVSSVSS